MLTDDDKVDGKLVMRHVADGMYKGEVEGTSTKTRESRSANEKFFFQLLRGKTGKISHPDFRRAFGVYACRSLDEC